MILLRAACLFLTLVLAGATWVNYRLSDRITVQREALNASAARCQTLQVQLAQCLDGWKRSSNNFDSVSEQAYRAVAMIHRWEAICDSLVEALHARCNPLIIEEPPLHFFIPEPRIDTIILLETIKVDTK